MSIVLIAPTRDSRIEQFDGLRAFAFLSVFAYHVMRVPMGWLGVDLFFVLSGFLITRNLITMRERSTFGSSLAVFYFRRLLRIVPPYYLVLVAMMVFVPLLRHEAGWYFGFASNIRDSVGDKVKGPPVTMWSIAVEEQFYLVWPFIVMLVPRNHWKKIFVAAVIAAPILRALLTPYGFDPIYRLMPTRMDLLALGALLGAIDLEDPAWFVRHARQALTVAVLGAVAYVAFRFAIHDFEFEYSSLSFNVFGYAFAACAVTGLLAYVRAHNSGPVYTVMTNPVLRYIGKISYTGYLIHDLIFSRVKLLITHGPILIVVTFVLTIAIASLSWYLVEQPLQRFKHWVTATPRTIATD